MWAALALLLGVFALLEGASAGGVSFTAVINNVAPTRVGMMGGGLITIKGQGFFRDGVEGTTTVFIGAQTCEMIEYFSSDTQIVCRLPSFPTQVRPLWGLRVFFLSTRRPTNTRRRRPFSRTTNPWPSRSCRS